MFRDILLQSSALNGLRKPIGLGLIAMGLIAAQSGINPAQACSSSTLDDYHTISQNSTGCSFTSGNAGAGHTLTVAEGVEIDSGLSVDFSSSTQRGSLSVNGSIEGGLYLNNYNSPTERAIFSSKSSITGNSSDPAVKIANSNFYTFNSNGTITSDDQSAIHLVDTNVSYELLLRGEITGHDSALIWENTDATTAMDAGYIEIGGDITGENGAGIKIDGNIEVDRVYTRLGDKNNSHIYGTLTGGTHGFHATDGALIKLYENNAQTTAENGHAVFIDGARLTKLTNIDTIEALNLDKSNTGAALWVDIKGDDFTITSINNSGDMTTDGGKYAIRLGSQSANTKLTELINSGTISNGNSTAANAAAIHIGNMTVDLLENSGEINGGDGYAIHATSANNGVLKKLLITGENTAKFIGTLQLSGTDILVDEGASFILTGNESFSGGNFKNEGTLRAKALDNDVSHDLSGFSSAADGTLIVEVDNDKFTKLLLDKGFNLDTDGKLQGLQNTLGGKLHVDATNLNANHNYQSSTIDGVTTLEDFIAVDVNGSISGKFAKITDNSTLFNFDVEYVPIVEEGTDWQKVNLTFKAANLAAREAVDSRHRYAARGAADALDRAFANDSSSELASAFVGFTDQGEAATAIDSTLPLLTGAGTQGSKSTMRGVNNVVQTTQGNSGLSSGENGTRDGRYWLKPFGSWTEQDSQKGIAGFESDTYGFVAGADAAVSDRLRLGLALGYGNTQMESKSKTAPQEADINSLQVVGFGSYAFAHGIEAFGQVDLGYHMIEGSRSMPLLNERAKADYDSYAAHAAMGVARSHDLGQGMRFTPSVRLDYAYIHDQSYEESGAGALNLHVDSRNAQELIASIDGRFDYDLSKATTVSANAGLGYDFIGEISSLSAAYAGASDIKFTTNGMEAEQWMYRAGLGIAHRLENNIELSARYDGEFRDGLTGHSASLKAKMDF